MSEPKVRWEPNPDFTDFIDGYLQGRYGLDYSYSIQSLGNGRFKLWDTYYTILEKFENRFAYRDLGYFDDLERAKSYAEQMEESKC